MANEFIARNGLISKNSTVISGSLIVTGGITGSLSGSATNATSASYALTASYAMNGGGGGGSTFPYTGNAVISGSLKVSGSGITVTGSVAVSGTTSFNNTITFYPEGSINMNSKLNMDGDQIQFNYGNYISVDAYGVICRNAPYLFLGDYYDGNNGTTIFLDDAHRLVKFGNFGNNWDNQGLSMDVKAQISTTDGSGYFLDPGVGGTATIHWDAFGNMTWGGVDYSPDRSSITFQPESATIWLFDSNQDTLHLAPLFIQSDYFTLSNYVSFDQGYITSNSAGALTAGELHANNGYTGTVTDYNNIAYSFVDGICIGQQ